MRPLLEAWEHRDDTEYQAYWDEGAAINEAEEVIDEILLRERPEHD